MKKLIFLFLFTLVSCSTTSKSDFLFKRKPASTSEISPEIISEIELFQTYVEEALVWRSKALAFAEVNNAKLKKEKLTHEDIENIHASAKAYVALREKILGFAFKYQNLVKPGTVVKYQPGEGTTVKQFTNVDDKDNTLFDEYHLDPLDPKGKDLLIKMKISLNAALVLYDSYMIGLYPYYKSRKMRKLLNQDIAGYKFEFDKITDSFFDVNQRTMMFGSIQLFKKDYEFKTSNKIELSQEETYLNLLALQSPFYGFMNEKYKPIVDPSSFRVYFDRIFDRSRFMNDYFTYTSSKIFGNTVGLVAFRKGLMTKLSVEERTGIISEMQPLDIMLEKTPFRLTDQFIPGFYGHVALWIGNEKELTALGIWDHPLIKPHQEEIRAGHHIIEALRPGVEINTLDHFLNIDEMLVMRDESLNDDQRRDYIVRAFAQLGKPYDFNFDVETDKAIVCSELVYVVFHNIDWPTSKALGRFTISPDNVASKSFDGQLKPTIIYSAGKRVEGDLVEDLRNKLK
jgi:hypothetical protein